MDYKRLVKGLLIPLTIFGLSNSALAIPLPDGYNPSGVGLKQSEELRDYYRLEKKVEQKSPADQNAITDRTEKLPGTAPVGTTRVFISQIAVDPSQLLTKEEVRTITVSYEDREVSMQELQTVVERINALYASKKYITAKALLPPQTIENGVVRIQLIEGRIGQLLLSGNRYTQDDFFLNRLNLAGGDLVRIDSLQQQLSYFNLTNDVRLRAELKPGKAFGTTDIVLIAQEPENTQTTLFSDNAGSKSTGLYRFGLAWTNYSLTGIRDTLTLAPVWSRGTFAGSAAYSVPVTGDGRWTFNYDRNRIDILSGPYADLNVEGYSSDLGLAYNWQRSVRSGFKSEQSLQVHRKSSETLFDGSKLLDADVNTAVMGFSIQASGNKTAAYINHTVTRGHSDTDSDSIRKHSDFVKYNLTVVRQRALDKGAMVTLRLNAQLTSDRNLPTVEQFSLGGMSSVRGYPTGLLLGDRGYFISAEWSRPLSQTVTGILFLDHGGALPYKGNDQSNTSDDFLTSAGFGMTMKFDDRNSAKLVLGFPLQHAAKNSPRVHFVWQSLL